MVQRDHRQKAQPAHLVQELRIPGKRAIVEAPGGLWFFKLTGLDATVKAATPAFDGLIGSIQK